MAPHPIHVAVVSGRVQPLRVVRRVRDGRVLRLRLQRLPLPDGNPPSVVLDQRRRKVRFVHPVVLEVNEVIVLVGGEDPVVQRAGCGASGRLWRALFKKAHGIRD